MKYGIVDIKQGVRVEENESWEGVNEGVWGVQNGEKESGR